MENESLQSNLLRRLGALRRKQAQMARDIGVAQATVNRVSLGRAVPSLVIAEKMFHWLDAHDAQGSPTMPLDAAPWRHPGRTDT
jgi:DNA-binding XRE family transcriptional regulator